MSETAAADPFGSDAAQDLAPRDDAKLWEQLRSTGDAETREQLFLFHLPYARALAARIYARRVRDDVEFSDLYQYACIGLLQALDRFDHRRGVAFRTFSNPRIQGSVLNGLEKLTEAQEQTSARKRMRRERLASLKSGVELAPSRSVAFALQSLSDVAIGLAIGFMLEGTMMFVGDEKAGGPDNAYESTAWRDLRIKLEALTEALPEAERRVLKLHYYHYLGFDQIGEIVGVSKGRISQIHRSGLDMLKIRLRRFEPLEFIR